MSDFIENMRQGMSNWFDSLTGQENTYHKSTGKTQKEYEQDIGTYKNLEDALKAWTTLASIAEGAAIGYGLSGGASAASGAGKIPEIIGDPSIALTNPSVAPAATTGSAGVLSTILPWLVPTVGGSIAGASGANAFLAQEENSNKRLGGSETPRENVQNDITSTSEDTATKKEDEPASSKEDEESSPSYDVDEMAGEFILGAWGNGQDRIDNMLNAGYTLEDYNKIQQRVNEAYASGRDLHEWTNKANEKLHYW